MTHVRSLGRVLSAGCLVWAASSSMGCDTDWEASSLVTDFRLLAAQADQPYARPGETVTLRTLAFDPRGRTIEWAYASCTNPESRSTHGCIASIDTPIQRGAGAELVMQVSIPPDTLERLPPGSRATASVGVVIAACPGRLSVDPQQRDAVSGPFRCTDDNGQPLPKDAFDVAIKRIAVRSTDRNRNPTFARVTWDGVEWPEDFVPEVTACTTSDFDKCPADTKHTIVPEAPTDVTEVGVDEHGVSFEEHVVVQYFGTDADFGDDLCRASSPKTTWVARASARGKVATLWFVVRDDRGGVSWATRRVNVR